MILDSKVTVEKLKVVLLVLVELLDDVVLSEDECDNVDKIDESFTNLATLGCFTFSSSSSSIANICCSTSLRFVKPFIFEPDL